MVYQGLCPSKPVPKPRFAAVRTLYHPNSDEHIVLDSDAVVLYLPGPKTVTGEDVLELHVHGGSATVKAVLSAIPACPALGIVRYAEPGEFTKRAFVNDRLDLAQVEALSDTLSAETEQQRRAAVRGASGNLGRTYEDWRQQLLQARAEVEAIIDFSEDQHFDESPRELLANVSRQVEEILNSIEKWYSYSFAWPPNVGKSSLMNRIVGREASIVSGEAGTTRDIVEAHLDIRGYLCTFADTAGFRSANIDDTPLGAIEKEGIRRARAKALESDIVVVLVSVEQAPSGDYFLNYDKQTLELLKTVGQGFVVVNKKDMLPEDQLRDLIQEFQPSTLDSLGDVTHAEPVLVSCKDAQHKPVKGIDPGGVQGVADRLGELFLAMTALPSGQEDLLGVTQRQRQLLIQCRRHLEDYVGNTTSDEILDELNFVVAAEDLRYAANCLARITGRGETGDIEEVLGVIFEKFCVGK
ncbi:GTP-binding protein TrmE [Truncatella angustata]|uniref:GTP-binding protein TrmE n=1 Tax=Truncatella angustata TaxID=152316 RepID=A0A9P8UMN1_9PEZI|nr:GTP-binding protein TrmE [Truncatella angustata]KAH6654960.1 GTP-binding protein TrmE [Truncatella angustata]